MRTPIQVIRERWEATWLMFMLPASDFRMVQLHLAARAVLPEAHRVEVYGAASGRWFRVLDGTAGETLIDARGPYAFAGALHALTGMAEAAERGEAT